MNITITARHCEIPDELRARASEVAERLAKIAHRPQRMEVIFDIEAQQKLVELRMSLPRGQGLFASAESDDHRTALDRAVEKLRSQLDKKSGRPARGERTA